MVDEFCCPKCKDYVSMSGNRYHCRNCKKFFLTEEGYVDFVGSEGFYAGEVNQQEMRQLIRDIDSLGYNEGLSSFLKKNSFLINYITDNRRVDWVCHALGKNNNRCLDIGSGLGNISEQLSRIYKKVYSLDAVKERIEFQKRRYKNSNRTNIILVRGNALEIPFPDNYFDLVVCNGLLEWIGLMNSNQDPRKIQINFLEEIKRVLSDNGCLYVGIENRIGLQFFLGAKDHSGLRYTSLLPRSLANLIVKRFGPLGGIYGDNIKKQKETRGYRTYTYSHSGYTSLFREAGLNSKTCWVIPGYNQPILSGRIDDVKGLKSAINFIRTLDISFKTVLSFVGKMPLPLLKIITRTFSPSFLFYCYKNDIPESIGDMITRTTKNRSYATYSGNKTIKYLLFDEKGNHEKVAHFKRSGYHLTDSIPFHDKTKPGESFTSDRIWLESWINGKMLNPIKLNEVKLTFDWLEDFQNKTRQDRITKNDILTEIDAVRKMTQTSFQIGHYEKWIDDYETYLSKIIIYRTAEHGDFWHGNVLIDHKTNEITLIDWQDFRERGNPLLDFISLIISGMQYPNNSLDEFELNLKGKGKFSPVLKELRIKIEEFFGFKINLLLLIRYFILVFIMRKQLEKDPYDQNVIRYRKILDLLSECKSDLL